MEKSMKIKKRIFSLVLPIFFALGLVACNTTKIYNVTFKDYDDTVLKVEEVASGKAATPPAEPIREGYTFEAWDKDFSIIKSDLIVKATYDINSYTVIFKDWDGTVLKEQKVNYTDSATPPVSPTREGYTFIGWDKDLTLIKTNLIVTAKYNLNEYTIVFKGLEKEVLKTEKVKHGSTYEVTYIPELYGYTFDGWFFDDRFNEMVDGPIVVTQGFDLFSKWDKNLYRVSYITNNDEIIDDEMYYYNDFVTYFPTLTKEDYYFEGWFLDSSYKTKAELPHKVLADTQFYARWTPLTDKLFTVTFKDWDGTLLSEVQVHGKSDAEFDINLLKREHEDWKYYYKFLNWDKPITNIVNDVEVKAEYQLKYNKVVKTTSSYLLRENGDLYQIFTNKQQNHVKIQSNVIDIAESTGNALDSKPKHLLVVKRDGKLFSMGSNDLGQLGDGTNVDKKDLTFIGENFVKVYAYYKSSYGIKADGSLYSWGNNQYSQLGLGHSRTIYNPTDTTYNYKDIAVNECGVIGLTLLGDLYSWGRNWKGALGTGTEDSTNSTPVFVDSGYKSISFGGYVDLTAYGIKLNGDVYNWGSNLMGDFGNGRSAYNMDSSIDLQNPVTLVPTKSLTGFNTISSNSLTVGISLTGQLYTWGSYYPFATNGITGTLEGEFSREPVLVAPFATEVFNVNGNWFFYGADGNLYGWGQNVSYLYDSGTAIINYVPILIEERAFN